MYKHKKIRSENKLTQEEFGQATGIKKIFVSKLKSSENIFHLTSTNTGAAPAKVPRSIQFPHLRKLNF